MKKLMIAAASAAMVGGAFADAQVWDMSMTVKTTESKAGTVKSACDACDGATSYRKQASVKINGVFWGCTCTEMVGLTGPVSENEGVFFWNATKKAAFYDQDAGEYAAIAFGWDLLNRIGQKATECEGVWNLDVGAFSLRGAGFGTVKGCDDASYISSMKGNFAGTYLPGNGCKRCEQLAGNAWALCDCNDADDQTAAYGTWTLKYNASATKKFANSEDWSWYKWQGDSLEAIKYLIAGGDDPDDPTAEKVAVYKKAVAAYEQAKADSDKVQAEVIDWNASAGNTLPAHANRSWTPVTIAGTVYQTPFGVDWTYAMASANEPYEKFIPNTTGSEQGDMDQEAFDNTIGKMNVAGNKFVAAGLTAANVTAFQGAFVALRDAEDALKNAQFAYGIKTAIAYDYANGLDGYTAAAGTKASIDLAEDDLKNIYNTDANYKWKTATYGAIGAAAPVVDNLKTAKDVLDDDITNNLGTDLAAEARKLIADYEAAMAIVAANKDAWEDAINERSKITAGMTTAEVTAKVNELTAKAAELGETLNLKRIEMAAAKANCGSACD